MRLLTVVLLTTLLASCATVPDQAPPTNTEAPPVTLTRTDFPNHK